ncbi:SIR2 family protein [Elizabethkingia meningoseptica]|uniref:SIR2 family protein n=1 Tax=Elizabethkingia meningoseptica TaxID=238 RepID=UPI002011030E|nr:SIR2 family protein [Elizabethkingia meningoseptica]MCL1675165.1 SIR2 family protein [Elizabethkingia meningoseptica]MCL1685467.1 SIR2 family protein [Elizabethkingia meningoseptica]
MEYFNPDKNKVFFGNSDRLAEWIAENPNQNNVINKIKLMLKNYLELDNVSFLFGSGTSIHLGAVAIRNFPKEVEEYVTTTNEGSLKTELLSTIEALQANQLEEKKHGDVFEDQRGWKFIVDDKIIRDNTSNEIATEYERVLNYLIAKDFVLSEDKSIEREDKIGELIIAIKEGLFNVCNLEKREVSQDVIDRKKASTFIPNQKQGELLETQSKYVFHEKFIKTLLQRPLNLRRANIFTANYDLAFEYAFDKLGVHYIDGFAGFHKRFFKPETFDYDIFYPGSTTSGKIQRIEKVVRYFKLHGSLSWVNSESRDSNNLYGIEEKPLELIESLQKKGEILIYPSAVKKSYTLDFPYSELFRQFASTITQSQSVLITIGYAFADDHFNDIIFQALSNPTFTLIIVDYVGTKSSYIKRIQELNDPRIIILEGEFFGDFLTFADTLMPNFNNVDNYEEIASTLNTLLGNNSSTPQIVEPEEPESENKNIIPEA